MSIRIRRSSHLLYNRNYSVDPLSLMCLHAEKWCGWNKTKQDELRRDFFNGARSGKKTYLGYHGMYLSVYPNHETPLVSGIIRLETSQDYGKCVGVLKDQEYHYDVIFDGLDAVSYNKGLYVTNTSWRPDFEGIWRFLMAATNCYVDDHLQNGALDDLLNWFTLEEINRWCKWWDYQVSGMRGPGSHFFYRFWDLVRDRVKTANEVEM